MNEEKIAIITDSCADLKPCHIGEDPIYVVPLVVSCGGRDFECGVDIDADTVYRQAHVEMPKTSLPKPASVYDALEKIREAGYTKVVAVMMSSAVSGTYNMVRLAGEDFDDVEVYPVDSLCTALGTGIIALQTMEYIKQGYGWEQLKHLVNRLVRNTTVFLSVDTLDYLRRGGRIGRVTAVAGTMLNLKPILGFTSEGELTSMAKCRGTKQAQKKMVELLKEHLGHHKRYNLIACHGGAKEAYPAYREYLLSEFPDCEKFVESELSAAVSVYTGPGMLGAGIQILDDVETDLPESEGKA